MNDDFHKLSDRLLYLIESKSVTAYQISKDTGLGEPILSNILRGKTKSPSNNTLDILSNYFNVNKEWLKSGTGDIYKSAAVSENAVNTVSIDREVLQTIISQQETIRGQLKIIEKLMSKENQKDAQADSPAECAGAHGA